MELTRSDAAALLEYLGIDTQGLTSITFHAAGISISRKIGEEVDVNGTMFASSEYAEEQVDRRAPNCRHCGHASIVHEDRGCVVAWCACSGYEEGDRG